jgi:multicomponent Na+:H+ antiporter subunit D
MLKIWNGVFWGKPELGPTPVLSDDGTRLRLPTTMVWSTAAAVGVALGIALWAGPIFDMAEQAATVLVQRTPYIDAVMQR